MSFVLRRVLFKLAPLLWRKWSERRRRQKDNRGA